jgi:hypothetical protein
MNGKTLNISATNTPCRRGITQQDHARPARVTIVRTRQADVSLGAPSEFSSAAARALEL